MIQDLHTEIDRLKRRIKLCERVTLGSLVGICVSVKFGHQEWIGLLFLILFCQISKLVFKRKLKQKEYLVKEVEERTQEIRSEKDAIQEESEKLAAASAVGLVVKNGEKTFVFIVSSIPTPLSRITTCSLSA